VVCVTGASSQLGVFLLPRLRAAGFRVLALSRRSPERALEVADGVSWMRTGCVLDGETGGPAMSQPSPDFLVSCGPLDLARRIVLRHPGLQRVVAFSSSSVHSKAASGSRAERGQMAAMAADEADLQAACADKDLPLLLLRPTLIWGCGLDRNVSLLAALARRWRLIPLAGRAGGLRQPVHADDLAALAVRALQSPRALRLAAAVAGGSTLTFREMAQRLAALRQPPARLLSLPESLLVTLVHLLSAVPGAWRAGLRGVNAEMVRRQNRDLVFDDSELRRALGWNPRPFEPGPEDFRVPERSRELQLPR
jgi:nucleoside-diphosphate-sugar epimerase